MFAMAFNGYPPVETLIDNCVKYIKECLLDNEVCRCKNLFNNNTVESLGIALLTLKEDKYDEEKFFVKANRA